MGLMLGDTNIGIGGYTVDNAKRFGVSLDDLVGYFDENGYFYKPRSTYSLSFDGVSSLQEYAMNDAFSDNNQIISVTFPDLIQLNKRWSLNKAFQNCASLKSISFPKLASIASTYSSGGTCSYAFSGCTSLSSVTFSALTIINENSYAMDGLFRNCTSLESISFPALTNYDNILDVFDEPIMGERTNFIQFLDGVSNCTVHFPSNLESIIGSSYWVTHGFDGTDTVVSFDLDATETTHPSESD